MRWGLDMLCPVSGGNWNNAGNAGVWALNLNNDRGNSNNNIGFRADSEPGMPHAAMADRHRGSPCRGLRRNLPPARPLVAHAGPVAGQAKTGGMAPWRRA
jgi:hypothetical protein